VGLKIARGAISNNGATNEALDDDHRQIIYNCA
jgi:hypothetical protein